ncbi:MAG: fatty acyl-AMP ligase [Archangium sp.]|nr:fatty acyl-AMP ligase [Archangium sp.]
MQRGESWDRAPLVIESLRRLAEQRPSAPLYTYVDERGAASTLTAPEMRHRALGLAHALVNDAGLQRGDRVLLVYPPGLEFVTALLGCMHAGLIAVPTAPPQLGLEAMFAIARDCKASAALTCRSFHDAPGAERVRQAGQATGLSRWLVTDAMPTSAELTPLPVEPNDTAVIQYTSGSTGTPRGVCISYRNLQHQLVAERHALQFDIESCYVFWLPHYHDFGLITAILGAAHGNGQVVFTSPAAFLRTPRMWGELLTKYRATHTASPDFGFKLFVKRTTPEERATWDLRSLRVLSSAGEPIRASTVDALLEALKPCGLDPATFAPCYGLAEHTVGITMFGHIRRRFSRSAMENDNRAVVQRDGDVVELFGCGPAGIDIAVRIVDPATRRALSEGQVGEVWADSASKALGYYGRDEETRETFFAQLEGDASRGWLRTGDLGALVDGELFITGRIKDMVILGGRNIYPQDVEEVVTEHHPLVRPGHVACFGVPDADGEQLVVVAELREENPTANQLADIGRAARAAMNKALGVPRFVLVLAKRDAVPRTTSGKLRRRSCRAAFLDNTIPNYVVDRGLGFAIEGRA